MGSVHLQQENSQRVSRTAFPKQTSSSALPCSEGFQQAPSRTDCTSKLSTAHPQRDYFFGGHEGGRRKDETWLSCIFIQCI